MTERNGTASSSKVIPRRDESFSSQSLYSRDVTKTKTLLHEENLHLAGEMKMAQYSLLETLCYTTYYQTIPFLEGMESYLRNKGDPRELIEYDPRNTEERKENIQLFYNGMEQIRLVAHRAPDDIKKRQRRISKKSQPYLQKISIAAQQLPLETSVWMDFALYLQEDGELNMNHQQELQQIFTKYTQLRNCLVNGNLRLVFGIAHQYRGKGLEYVDLIQEGNIGLMKGVERFDPAQGYHLSTYANYWIRHTIQRALSNHGREIRTPAHAIEKITKMLKVERVLGRELGRKPTTAEIAERTDFSEKKVEELQRYSSRRIDSLQEPRYTSEDSSNATIEDTIENEQAQNSLERAIEQRRAEEVRRSLELLSSRDREVLTSRFGIGDDQDQTLRKVGKRYGLTRERIRQIEAKALQRMNGFGRLRDLARR